LSGSRTSFSSPATHTWSGSTWNHNGTWTHNGHGNFHNDHFHNGHDHFHNGFFGFFGFPWYWGWGGYGGYGGYYPYYGSGDPGYAYNYTPDSSYSAPSYNAGSLGEINTTTPSYNRTLPRTQPSAIDDNAVLIGLRVPENAEVWIDGQKTTETGAFREFTSPALQPGQKFTYDIKARWTENGKEVVRDRKLEFYAGDRLMVNLLAPVNKATLPPPQPAPAKKPTPQPPAPAPIP
jgi:uncharacterized protein (TIGR03000 family)